MLIPIGHENMSARRWPIITSALILINILAFLATNSTLQKEGSELQQLRMHILLLAAMHPEIEVPPEVEPLVTDFREKYPAEWKEIEEQKHELIDEYDAEMRLTQDPDVLQEQMNSMAKDYARISDSYIAYQYAFVPAHPKLIAYLTANFLHGGWLHLIGNMWFLWLAGFVLEDTWGRTIYLISYIIAGAAALQFHAWTNVGSLIPTLGASGAVAALMGAFLVRFPKIKIEMIWIYLLVRSRRFHAPAYGLLPLWLLTEVFYGAISGEGGGVAHWAHVGGFIFGAAVALVLRFSGIERTVNAAIDQKITGNEDPEITRAQDCIDHKKFEEAVAILRSYTAAKPASLEAWMLLRDALWQKGDTLACQQIALKCCEMHLKAHDNDAAWCDYEDYVSSGGKDLPLGIRFDLCRLLENRGDFETAVSEYRLLAAELPMARQALMSQLAAAKICLKKLSLPHDALAFYEAAQNSPFPHLDFDATIQSGIQEAKTALAFLSSTMGSSQNKSLASNQK